MAEHPRLNELIGLAYTGADDGDGVLQGDARDRSVEKKVDKLQGLFLLALLALEPPRSADGKVGTRRVGDQQLPAATFDVIQNVALDRKSTRLNSTHRYISYSL